MRFLLLLAFVFSPTTVMTQSLPEWYRVYTFDESTVEMNTALVTRTDKDISRLRFRWIFNQPESLDGMPELKYQSQLEVMEFNCSVNQYRSYHLTLLDKAGNIVRIRDVPGEWHAVNRGSMIEKLFVPGCDLVKKNTRNESRAREAAQCSV